MLNEKRLRMKLAIADACIFIDLHELSLTSKFFKLDFEFHTSLDVFRELFEEQQMLLSAFQTAGKLNIHNILEVERIEIRNQSYPRSLSESDKTVIHLAVRLGALVISSDKAIRNVAKNYGIEYHGMLWIFDRLVESQIISKAVAVLKLKQLITTNTFFQNNAALMEEVKKRIQHWADKPGSIH